MNSQKSKYGEIINFWLEQVKGSSDSNKNKTKKILELCHFASFVIALENNEVIQSVSEVKIRQLHEEPDFIIDFKGEIIGVELQRIKNIRVEIEGRKNSLLNKAEIVFKSKYPDVTLLANIRFKNGFDYTKKEISHYKNQISDMVFEVYNNPDVILPDYLERVFIQKHTRVDFCTSGVYSVGNLNAEEIIQEIQEKDGKVDTYRQKTNIQKQMLLLVVSGATPDSDYSFIELPQEKDFNTSFDFVFLLNDFKKEVFALKN